MSEGKMSQRIKYPLTEAAKEAARQLVEFWDSKRINQLFQLLNSTAGNAGTIEITPGIGAENIAEVECPEINTFLELAQFRLISVVYGDNRWEVLLMQELRNAVATDFEVSDYFLTTQAVGTVVVADQGGTVRIGALQSASTIDGSVTQTQNIETSEELAQTLAEILKEIIKSNATLADAINDLTIVPKADKQTFFSKVGKVITELGRCLQDTANATVVIQAIFFISQFLQNLK
jgi:hypothetical protein